MSNTFGNIFKLTTFGESHGPGIGGIIDGMPAGITVDLDFLQSELNRRRPGQSALTTDRKEADKVELLSGIFEGKTTGCPIGFLVRNENQHSNDYDNMRDVFRPSHADFTYQTKYGIRDHRGGGRTSARGIISCVIKGCPIGLGEPVFGKLHAQLGAAMLSINAVKGFEYGEGFAGVTARGSEQNDLFQPDGKGGITTLTNHSGGIQGGLSNGQDIFFRVAFKPVATLLREQPTVNKQGQSTLLKARGRHDPCVLPRAVPIVEAMAAMVILDNYMLNNTSKC